MDHTSQQSLALLAAIIASSGDAILSCDEHDRITSWNPAAERLFGFTAGEAIGQSALIIVPPASHEERRRLLEHVVAAGATQTLDTKHRRHDGALIDVELTVSPLRDLASQETIGFSSIVRDISQHLAQEQKLKELESRFHTFFDRMPGLTYIYAPKSRGPDYGVLHVSQQFEDLTGYAPETWRNDDDFIGMIVHPDDREWLTALNRETEQAGGPLHAEYRIITSAGQERWIRDQANLVHDEQGEPLYWLGFMLDISDQKRAEAATREAVSQLEATNHQLEQVSTAKSEFVSVISHEFRTPLTSIQGYSELIATEALTPDEARGFATTINQNALRLSRMIGNMLDLDRLEAGQAEVYLEHDDLNHLVETVLTSLRTTTTEHQLIAQLDPELPLLWYDPDLIVRVITNLVANAIKYSPSGGPVTVATSQCPEGVALTVRDEGMGIPADHREAIFSRFSRIARREQQGIEGTGLGLPIARQIVSLHGGEIWVTDNDPTGSIVHVLLRANRPE